MKYLLFSTLLTICLLSNTSIFGQQHSVKTGTDIPLQYAIGYEFESNEGFLLIKVGTAFTNKFEQGWNVEITMDYDIKEENRAPAIGISIEKKLDKFR